MDIYNNIQNESLVLTESEIEHNYEGDIQDNHPIFVKSLFDEPFTKLNCNIVIDDPLLLKLTNAVFEEIMQLYKGCSEIVKKRDKHVSYYNC